MSATTENIIEELRQVEQRLEAAKISGNVSEELDLLDQVVRLRRKLNLASHALNESKQILKG